jgi:hypothetical protein
MDMERSIRLRLVLAAPVLGVLYFYLLVFLIGWTSAQHWPPWWFAVFPSRHFAAVAWMVILHTVGVFSAAVPIAFAAVIIVRKEAVLLGAIAGVMATMLAVLLSLSPHIWPIVWGSHPVFFVTDQIKLLAAVPIAAWLIRKISANNGLSATAFRQRA